MESMPDWNSIPIGRDGNTRRVKRTPAFEGIDRNHQHAPVTITYNRRTRVAI